MKKKVSKEIESARKTLFSKSKVYYSNEALNPRPKRGRPPKQALKVETDIEVCSDIFTTVPPAVSPFLFIPDITNALDVTFSAKHESGEDFVTHRVQEGTAETIDENLSQISEKLAALRELSSRWADKEKKELGEAVASNLEEEEVDQLNPEEKKLFKKLEKSKESIKSKTTSKEKKPSKPNAVKKLAVKEPPKNGAPEANKKPAPKKEKVDACPYVQKNRKI